MAKYFLIAGEASGDMHAAALIKQIQARDPKASFSGLGGSQMAAAECHLYQDYTRMAFMGFAASASDGFGMPDHVGNWLGTGSI